MRRFRCRRAVRHVPAARPFKLPTFIGVLSRVAGSRHDLFWPSACPGLYIGGMTTIDEIVENFTLLDQWDDRYRYVIELGRTLAPLPESAHSEANKVRGCASQVWLLSHVKPDGAAGPTLTFDGDSDAHIVRGLIAILLALYSGKKARDILEIDALKLFDRIGLRENLTPQRSNGLRSMVERIRAEAKAALATAAVEILLSRTASEASGPGIHTPKDWGYGFRSRGPRPRPGMTADYSTLNAAPSASHVRIGAVGCRQIPPRH